MTGIIRRSSQQRQEETSSFQSAKLGAIRGRFERPQSSPTRWRAQRAQRPDADFSGDGQRLNAALRFQISDFRLPHRNPREFRYNRSPSPTLRVGVS
jgi:hypothetical protein